MSKKHQHAAPVLSLTALRERVVRASNEGRFQTALDLAKQLYKAERSPEHEVLLRKVYLGRAGQLRQAGQTRDAASVLDAATTLLRPEPAWLGQVALEYAACGQAAKALALLGQVSDADLATRIQGTALDAAIAQGASGIEQLPEALRDLFQRIRRAFVHLEKGEDDAAREVIQGMGLQSPAMEWKLLIRGLLAYYQNDDTRAIENWQRLRPERLPARLAAPFRFQIDPAYRQAQPPDVQTRLLKAIDRHGSPGLVPQLRSLQVVLNDPDQLPQAFRKVEPLLPLLRQQAPELIPRLADCFFWTIVAGGEPGDVQRFRRAFGSPADDPNLDRLCALATERIFQMGEAHKYWTRFAEAIAANPQAWPCDTGRHAQALVWYHMGRNAESVPDVDAIPGLPSFLRDYPHRPQPLQPGAEACFKRSLELVPEGLAPADGLVNYYLEKKKDKQAAATAEALLKHHPQHLPTLEALANIRIRQKRFPEALELYQRALNVNPLDRRLRDRLIFAHLLSARHFAEEGQFDLARAEFQWALSHSSREHNSSVYCKWAACEFKAKNPDKAEELLRLAVQDADTSLAVDFGMLIEAIRLKLPRALKQHFDQQFKQRLAEPPTAAGATELATTAGMHRASEVTYVGQKSHEKQVLQYLDRAHGCEFTLPQLQAICQNLLALEAPKYLRKFTELGRKQFPSEPVFPLLEAESYFGKGPRVAQAWKVRPLLTKARELAMALPPDERRKELLERIQSREDLLGASGLFGSFFFDRAFRDMFGNADFDELDGAEDDGF